MIAAATRLEMRGIGKRFGGVTALADVSLDARSGEVHAICGENGAGKSTLMKILSGAILDYDGELVLNGRAVRFDGPRDAEEQGVSIIYQELNLVGDLSASANIFLGRERLRGGVFIDDRAMDREAAGYFEQLGAHFSPRVKVRNLRIGDQQLVEIAKALSLDADILIMDEPTSALAESEVARLYKVIQSLKSQGVTILYISHKMDEVFKLADRITVLRDGRHVKTLERNETTPREVINLMVGREIAALDLKHAETLGTEVLRVEGLTLPHRDRPGQWQLDHVDLSLRTGEVLGIAGLLGAGRTELLECLFGAPNMRPKGRMFVEGREGLPRSPREAIRRGIAMVTEDRKNLGLFDQMTVGFNITICHLKELLVAKLLSGRLERKVTESSIERLRIRTDGPGAGILSLSGGNQQKCIIARWLLTQPKILLLDEPTRGIDVGAKAEIYLLLRELCQQGIGIIMTSSELPELLAVSDRILVLCEGRKTAEFSRAEASEEKIVHAAMDFSAKR
ncbi:MAG: sugar ABC transporter ATP-binding protein [Planctomycetota bacterium]